jgi:hypothetical protein
MTVVDGGAHRSPGAHQASAQPGIGDAHPSGLSDRLVAAIPLALVLTLLGWAAARAARPISDPDDWWHLRLGNELIAQHSLSAPGHWSSFATISWVPTEPLPEVVAAGVERWMGLPGLAVLFAVVLVAFVLTVHVTHRRHAALLPASVATVLTVLAASPSLTSRPQLISFVLLPVVLSAWLQTERDLRPRWWLVPLTWLWSLCHGFWIFGVVVGLTFVVGIALSGRPELRTLARLVAVAAGSLAVVALNPVGLGVLAAPLAVQRSAQYISEWQRTDLLSPGPAAALLMIVVTAVLWVIARQRVTWSRVFLLLGALFLVWYAARLVVVGALLAGPLFAAALDALVLRTGDGTGTSRRLQRPELMVGVLGALAAIACTAVAAPQVAQVPRGVPLGLDAQLDRLPEGTPVFNSYELGGWLTWRHPALEQYIDGLVTPYSAAHVRDYALADAAGPGWYRVVRDSHAPVALLAARSPLAAALVHRGWTTAGTSSGYVLLDRPTAAPRRRPGRVAPATSWPRGSRRTRGRPGPGPR